MIKYLPFLPVFAVYHQWFIFLMDDIADLLYDIFIGELPVFQIGISIDSFFLFPDNIRKRLFKFELVIRYFIYCAIYGFESLIMRELFSKSSNCLIPSVSSGNPAAQLKLYS